MRLFDIPTIRDQWQGHFNIHTIDVEAIGHFDNIVNSTVPDEAQGYFDIPAIREGRVNFDIQT